MNNDYDECEQKGIWNIHALFVVNVFSLYITMGMDESSGCQDNDFAGSQPGG